MRRGVLGAHVCGNRVRARRYRRVADRPLARRSPPPLRQVLVASGRGAALLRRSVYVGLVALGIVAIGTIYYFLFARTTTSHVYQAPCAGLSRAESHPGQCPRAGRANSRRVHELRSPYGIVYDAPEVPFVDGKRPSDVYGNLARIGNMLESLGVPPHEPKDVYRLVETLNRELEHVALARGDECTITDAAVSGDKQPADVYSLAYDVLVKLKQVRIRSRYLSTNGADLLQPNLGDIAPGDVLDLINNLVAETAAIEAEVDISKPTVLAPAQPAKIPSDVFSAVSRAGALVDCMLAGGAT